MTMVLAWAAVTALLVLAVHASVRYAERLSGLSGPPPALRGRLLALLGTGVLLGLLGLLYQLRPLAEADARLVAELAAARSDGLTSAMRIITTIGDTVPSYTIAAVLTLVLVRTSGIGLWAAVLPLVVLVELVVQFGFDQVFPVLSLTEVTESVAIDGSGVLPSGSVARLFALALLTAVLLVRAGRRPTGLAETAAVLVTVQAVSRLYLGRHFVGDVLGGLLLGLALVLAVSLLLSGTGPKIEQNKGVRRAS